MSQMIACKNQHGIVLAADSQAAGLQLSGGVAEVQVERMIQLSPGTAILTGGSAEGASMCQALQTFIGQEGLNDVNDIYRAALPFLASAYEGFMRKQCQQVPLDPVHPVVFLLAGVSHRDEQDPYQLYLLWAKKKLPQLDGEEVSSVFVVPRSLKLENRLDALCRDNVPLSVLFDVVRPYLENVQ